MNLYYPTEQPPIAANILIRRQRLLPVGGDVLVRSGNRVEPDDVVASAIVPGEPVIVDVARLLGIAPERAARLLTQRIGAEVGAGEIVAARRGFGRSGLVRTPAAGKILDYDDRSGLLTISPPPETLNLQAKIRGLVTEVIPYRGVSIETPAAVVRGVFGFGGEKHGVLKVASSDPTEELLADRIDARLTYAIVLGGCTTSAAALLKAVEHGVRAIVVGSIPEAELRAFLNYPQGIGGWSMGRTGWDFPPRRRDGAISPLPDLTLVVTEGFGAIPMSTRAWELLAAYDGQEAAVDGTTRLRDGLARPEVVVPLSRAEATLPRNTATPPVDVGAQVRLLGNDNLGAWAEVLSLSAGKRALPSGIMANAAEVRLRDNRRLWVPIYNLEVIEGRRA